MHWIFRAPAVPSVAQSLTARQRKRIGRECNSMYRNGRSNPPFRGQAAEGDVDVVWGFNDLSHFNKAFRARFDMTPREWRNST
jgi:methylphosphotriester-DNA--protein-cysteine methyltransferase